MLGKEERRLKKAKISLMRNPKFALWSGVLMVGKTGVSETFPTACTDGRNEIYGREFIKGLDDKELAFVVLHENLHKALRHLFIWKKLDAINRKVTNAACDYVINLMIHKMDPQESFVAMPRKDGKIFGLFDKRFDGMNTKQVFDILMEERGKCGGNGDGEGEGGGGFDDHDWDGAKDMTEEEKKELAREIDQAIRQGLISAQKAGTGTGGLDRELEGLMEPKVNWREVLREFVKATCSAKDTSSWRRVNRRFLSTGTYMPTLIGEKVGHLVVGVDTSGSVGGKELAEFLSEVKGIAEEVNPETVDLLYWDGEVAAHETYSGSTVSTIVQSTKPAGGGGTSPSCVSTYLKEKSIAPECIIMLTDGYVGGDWGNEWTAPLLWVIVGGNDDVAPNGKTIHIRD